jgi:hypothetical protein
MRTTSFLKGAGTRAGAGGGADVFAADCGGLAAGRRGRDTAVFRPRDKVFSWAFRLVIGLPLRLFFADLLEGQECGHRPHDAQKNQKQLLHRNDSLIAVLNPTN